MQMLGVMGREIARLMKDAVHSNLLSPAITPP